MLHSVGTTFQEDLFDFEELCVVKIIVGVVNLVNHFSDAVLAFIKLVRILFAALFVIGQKRLNELNQLINSFCRR